jgi:hypothetical protein
VEITEHVDAADGANHEYDGHDGTDSPMSAPLALDPALLATVGLACPPEPGLMALWTATDDLFGLPQPS